MSQYKTIQIYKGSESYPKRLIDTLGYDAPDIIYVKGCVELLYQGGVAIVGPRDADKDVFNWCKSAGIDAALAGKQVISGGARGCDSYAMQGSMDGGVGGVVVLPSSVSYAQNCMMRTYVSICPPGDGFSVRNAMQRNKVIYGLADMVLVADCHKGRGGTWRGAFEFLTRYNSLPVYVHARDGQSSGVDDLISRGAKPFKKGDIERFYGLGHV